MSFEFSIPRIAVVCALSAGLLAACGDTSDVTPSTPVDAPVVDTTPVVMTAPASQVDIANLVVGKLARPAGDSDLITVEADRVTATVNANGPAIGLGQAYPVTDGQVYEVTVTFEIVDQVGEGQFDITAWSLDEMAALTSDKAYSVRLLNIDYTPGEVQTATAQFALNGQDLPGVLPFADPDRVRQVRFTTNPARRATGTRYVLHDIDVTPIQ